MKTIKNAQQARDLRRAALEHVCKTATDIRLPEPEPEQDAAPLKARELRVKQDMRRRYHRLATMAAAR